MACNFIQKETLVQVFSFKFCNISFAKLLFLQKTSGGSFLTQFQIFDFKSLNFDFIIPPYEIFEAFVEATDDFSWVQQVEDCLIVSTVKKYKRNMFPDFLNF